MKISAVIVAAGNSSRMGQNDSKLFIELDGKTVIRRSLEVFDRCDFIDEIILVCRDCDISRMKKEGEKINKLKEIIIGGKDRQDSVINGVNACSDCDFIAIHDGARPLVSEYEIEKVCKDAKLYKSSTLAVKVKDTIKKANDSGFVTETPNRDFLYAVQTPQVFDKKLYLGAVELATAQSKSFTDDCQLMENFGQEVFLSEGFYTNIKITTPEDVAVAISFLKLREDN